MVWGVSWLVWLDFCVCVCVCAFILFYFLIEIPLTQRTACSLTCGPPWEGSPNFFSGRNDGAFFCAPTLQGFAGLPSFSTLRNLPRLFHLMCVCLSGFPAPQSSAAIAGACYGFESDEKLKENIR